MLHWPTQVTIQSVQTLYSDQPDQAGFGLKLTIMSANSMWIKH